MCCLLPCEGPCLARIHIFFCWWNLPILSPREHWEMKNGWKAFEIVCMITITLLQWRECACHVLLHVTQRPCSIQKTLIPMSYKGWQYLLYFFPFSIDIEVLFPVRVSVFVQQKWFLFHFSSSVLPFNLAALKNWVLATTKRLDLAFCFISASCDPQGGSLHARLHSLEMGDCARTLFVWLSSPLLSVLKSAWQFGSMALAPQELPSDKMSPWLCSTRPIGWPDELYTWQADGQNTEQEARGAVQAECDPVLLISLYV